MGARGRIIIERILKYLMSATLAFATAIRNTVISFTRGYGSIFGKLPGSVQKKNIVILGASFGGWKTCENLVRLLPKGYGIVLIDKTSHHFHPFVFPRFSVIGGHEQKAFVPRHGQENSGSETVSVEVKITEAMNVDLNDRTVCLSNGEKIDYEVLVMATGCELNEPGSLPATTKEEGIKILKNYQELIEKASDIAVIGSGAVGVQLATDIMAQYGASKKVDLYSSRDGIMPKFPKDVQETALKVTKELGVNVILKERPKFELDSIDDSQIRTEFSPRSGTIILQNGEKRTYSLIFVCTGQKPRTKLISQADDTLLTAEGYIRVKPTLQVDSDRYPNFFAVGDVADSGAPKMGRVTFNQGEVAAKNISDLLQGNKPSSSYIQRPKEGALHLSLGFEKSLFYIPDGNGNHSTRLGPAEPLDLELSKGKVWNLFAADISDFSK